MCKIWTKPFILLFTLSLLTGCATSKDELLPHGDENMLDIWNTGTGGSAASNEHSRLLLDARLSLRRSLTDSDLNQSGEAYTRTAQNEIYRQFQRLPNPDLVMYVFPHLAGNDPVPVPGYSTVFPLYQKIQYAMPAERVEPY